ncbi:MAG: hypothetical protein OJF59_002387 [Cytophagales bacterium]|nr:MAG: hypothetical protein OJF59_002387 [Cytophagales bacterium]
MNAQQRRAAQLFRYITPVQFLLKYGGSQKANAEFTTFR